MERKREQIPMLGIHTSAPGQTVKDGACEDIFNMRYKNGALQNVFQPELLEPIIDYNGFNIVHRMESLPQGHYIATSSVIDQSAIWFNTVKIVSGVVTLIGDNGHRWGNVDPSIKGDFKISSFGNAFYVTGYDGDNLKEDCYIYKDGTFSFFDINNITPPEFDIQCGRKFGGDAAMGGGVKILKSSNNGKDNEFMYGPYIEQLNNEGYFVGACIIMAAYVMYDGSIIKPTTPEIVTSYNNDVLSDQTLKCLHRSRVSSVNNNAIYTDTFSDSLYGAKLSLKLKSKIPDMHLIKGVRIFSTRINQAFIYEDISTKIIGTSHNETASDEAYINRSLIVNEDAYDINQPFYELVDILKIDPLNIDIETKKLNDVIYNPVYKPSYSLHSMIGSHKFEYNNRLHIYNIKTTLFKGYYDSLIYPTLYPDKFIVSKATILVSFELNVDNQNFVIHKQSQINLVKYYDGRYVGDYFVVPNIITYPDTRVTNITVKVIYKDFVEYEFSQSAKQAAANNLSYIYLYNCKQTDNASNVVLLKLKNIGRIYVPETTKKASFYQGNKLHVSAPNNPFYIAPVNIYTICENWSSIDAINTATEQVSETKFGVYPLYVFTDTAIYAMEVGQDNVLYSNIIGVSNLRKLPSTTTVGAANYVFFISDQGVMAIEGRRTFCISSPIDDNKELPSRDFELYLSQAKLDYNPKENELIVHNSDYDYAYIYSLEQKIWTRRVWDNGVRLSNFQVVRTGGIYSTLGEDETKPYPNVSVTTRAIKLGSLEYKRIESVVVRIFEGSLTSYTVTLEGSNDLRSWQSLIKVRDMCLLRRTMASYKYHRLKLDAIVGDYFTFTHFDVEFYNRFVRLLR